MTRFPKISVVVPSFNQGQFLEETLVSLLSQNYPDLEILVVDGGSTDHSVSVIRRYEKHLAWWVSEKDSGQSEAINKGFRRATGEIITWLNSDDIYSPDTLQTVAAGLNAETSAGFFHGKSRLFGEGLSEKIVGTDQMLTLHDYLPYMRFPQPSSFFRKRVIDTIGPLNEELHYAMDFELCVRAILAGEHPLQSFAILSGYRMHTASKSNNETAFLREWSDVFINVLHSLPGGQKYIALLKQAGITTNQPAKTWTCNIRLNESDLENAFLQHLDLHFHNHYRGFSYKDCRRIASFIRSNFPGWYSTKQYKKFLLRMRFVPKFVLRLARKRK